MLLLAALLAAAPAMAQTPSGGAQGQEKGATREPSPTHDVPSAPRASEKDTPRQKSSALGDKASDRDQKARQKKTAKPRSLQSQKPPKRTLRNKKIMSRAKGLLKKAKKTAKPLSQRAKTRNRPSLNPRLTRTTKRQLVRGINNVAQPQPAVALERLAELPLRPNSARK